MPITSDRYPADSTKFEWGAGFRAVNLFSKPHLFGSLTSFPAGAQLVLVSYELSFLFAIEMRQRLKPLQRKSRLSLFQGDGVSLWVACVADQHPGRCLERFSYGHASLR